MKNYKNPHLYDIREYLLDNSKIFKYLSKGNEAFTYYFKLDKSLIIKGNNLKSQFLKVNILKPGSYVLKLYDKYAYLNYEAIKWFIILSNYGLIPKIYIINTTYIIMDYIEGHTMDYLYENYPKHLHPKIYKNIEEKIKALDKVWKKLLKDNYDLIISRDFGFGNIIVSEDFNNVYIIDPIIFAEPRGPRRYGEFSI